MFTPSQVKENQVCQERAPPPPNSQRIHRQEIFIKIGIKLR